MVIYEENGLKQSFKIFVSLNGVLIKTHGTLSKTYKDVYSRRYNQVGSIEVKDRFVYTEFSVGGISLKFSNSYMPKKIQKLITLGKTNSAALEHYIGSDSDENDLAEIDIDELEEYVDKNRFGAIVTPKEVVVEKPKKSCPQPPPVIKQFSYYVLMDEKQEGPYDKKQFERLVQYGMITSDTYVWTNGMSEWQKASDVQETACLFTTGLVPPLPQHKNS